MQKFKSLSSRNSHANGCLLLHKVVLDDSMLVLDDNMLQVPDEIKSSVVNV